MTINTPHTDTEVIPATMIAYRVNEFGPPDVIRQETVPTPLPGRGEVLIKVGAAGVGPWDAWIRSGKSAVPQPLPLTLGSDLSGKVVAIGQGVDHLTVEQSVFGVTNARFTNAYAEYAIADAAMVGPKPKSLSDIEAASLPVIATTARQALFEYGGLVGGQTVLIHGGGGNVGAYAVQLARLAWLNVIATASTEDVSFVKQMGAHNVIDYRKERFEDRVKDVDAVIDLVGGETQSKSFPVIRKGGTLVSAVSKPDQTVAKAFGVNALFFLVKVSRMDLANIAAAVDTGELNVRVGDVLPMADAIKAHRMLEGQIDHGKGKIVLKAES